MVSDRCDVRVGCPYGGAWKKRIVVFPCSAKINKVVSVGKEVGIRRNTQ